jgi:hypothetical protein
MGREILIDCGARGVTEVEVRAMLAPVLGAVLVNWTSPFRA